MKKLLLCSMGLSVCLAAGYAGAQTEFPFSDDFESGTPAANWDADSADTGVFFRGTFDAVGDDVDWRGVLVEPPGGDFMGRLSFITAAAGTFWRVVGQETAQNYTIETDIFVPTVDAPAAPDNFLYQMVVVWNAAGYTRLHFQHNLDTATLANGPRFRLQAPGLATLLESPTADAVGTDEEGWYNVRLVMDHSAATVVVFINDVEVTSGPLAVPQAAYATGGKAGIAGYINGDTLGVERSVYFDNFYAGPDTTVNDWAVFE